MKSKLSSSNYLDFKMMMKCVFMPLIHLKIFICMACDLPVNWIDVDVKFCIQHGIFWANV